MTSFLAIVRLELLRRLRDPVASIVWLAIPFLLIGILVLVFGGRGDQAVPRIVTLVVDHDGGLAGRALSGALASPGLARILDARSVDPDEAAARMKTGDVSLVVEIPEGFTRAFLDGQAVTLSVRRNPAQSILPAVGEDVVRFLARDAELLRAVLAPLLTGIADRDPETPPTLREVQEISARFYDLLSNEQAGRLLRLDRFPVERRLPPSRGRSEVVGWFAPGFVALALLFIASGQSQEIQEDLLAGRLTRALSFPRPLRFTLAAKGLATVLTVWTTATVLEILLAAVLGWRPAPLPAVVLHTLAVAVAFSGLAMLLRGLTRNPEAGGAASSGIMVGLGFLGGCFVPVVMLPDVIRETARWIPTGWAVDGFIALQGSAWAGPMRSVGLYGTLSVLFGVVCFLGGARLLERRMQQP